MRQTIDENEILKFETNNTCGMTLRLQEANNYKLNFETLYSENIPSRWWKLGVKSGWVWRNGSKPIKNLQFGPA